MVVLPLFVVVLFVCVCCCCCILVFVGFVWVFRVWVFCLFSKLENLPATNVKDLFGNQQIITLGKMNVMSVSTSSLYSQKKQVVKPQIPGVNQVFPLRSIITAMK